MPAKYSSGEHFGYERSCREGPGRPNCPIAFKRRLAVESCEPEICVAKLALRHGLNANMLFK